MSWLDGVHRSTDNQKQELISFTLSILHPLCLYSGVTIVDTWKSARN